MPYFDKETAGLYNSFVNYYIHQVNAMRFILGENYRVTYADKSGVLMAVESTSGICGVIEMAPYNNTVDWEESILVAFEKGYVRIDLPQPRPVSWPALLPSCVTTATPHLRRFVLPCPGSRLCEGRP